MKHMAKLIAGAAFLAGASTGNAAEPAGIRESFMELGSAMGEACTRDKNSIQYSTDFLVSYDDLQVNGIEGGDFAQRYAQQLSARMKTIWSEVASGYDLNELQTDRAKLHEMGEKLNAAQKDTFDKFEQETGITVMTDTSAIGTRKGCSL